MDENKYLTVTALSHYIKRKFVCDPYLHRVYLKGEISNYRYRPHAHQYFSLKDDHAKIDAVMFHSQFKKIKFRPEEGMKVLATGRISVYEPQGSYQIYIDRMEPKGVGALYEAYEQLKAKLAQKGWFNPAHKQSLIKFPKRMAVITSRNGAVIRDIIVTTRRRYPITQIVLFPAVVQGNAAARDLVRQIKRVNQWGNFDTLIIGRGGGSIEDLWPFNEESVARAIYDSQVPVISSVGHETDVTIADLVADQRAATPTAAAELATPVLADEVTQITDYRTRIINAFKSRLAVLQQRLNKVQQSYVFRQPKRLYETYVQQVDNLTDQLTSRMHDHLNYALNHFQQVNYQLRINSPQQDIRTNLQRLKLLEQRMKASITRLMQDKKTRLEKTVGKLDQLSPLRIMSHGYSYVTSHHHVIKNAHDLKRSDQIHLNFYDGDADATVDHVHIKKEK